MKNLAERLIWARERKSERDGMEFTQQALANAAGVSQSTIGNLEAGIRRSAQKLVMIAAALGVDPMWLSEGTGKPFPVLAVDTQSANDDGDSASDLARIAAAYRDSDKEGRKALIDAAETIYSRLKAKGIPVNNRQS